MPRKVGRRLRRLVDVLAAAHPNIDDPAMLIRDGGVAVDGLVRTNPASLVPFGASVSLIHKKPLRGEAKLRFALDVFEVRVEGRVALDVGAAAGGFTRVLLQAGARLVYAVDAGHGQLLGSLRQDSRVVNLEGTNLAVLDESLIPGEVQVVSVDVSYVSLALAVPQLERVQIASDADLLALVKPQFELGLAKSPASELTLSAALDRARAAIDASPWNVVSSRRSPVRGRKGSAEFLIHARRQ